MKPDKVTIDKAKIDKSQANKTLAVKNKADKKTPDCFGELDTVFPMTESGLRQTPENCFENCSLKTACLKQAMTTKQATQVEEEIIERGSRTGAINFFERWSRKKQVHRKQQADKNKADR